MRVSKELFFKELDLPEKIYLYTYNGDEWEITAEEVIYSLPDDQATRLSLGIMKELNVSMDFLLNVFLQEVADDLFEIYRKREIMRELEDKIFNAEGKDVFFELVRKRDNERICYVFYESEGRYYLQKESVARGLYQGYKRLGKIDEKLSQLVWDSKVEFKRA
ncbi:hypothetical protein RGU11_06805 [Rossellomorea marisflavi]|jgi:hypothetical protein|uniref:hypothetical protein n=1 Tax=Rossellomorea marisflavi TaxID=189381 RepID=UPI0028536B9D|nr:hypothetical protein [Rossellomorea marisflavi]MDR4936076.1 hypothetical protein [Rossellomorea marisflavi]